MPTKTFFNLTKKKSQKIIEASKSEFSKYNFYDASINRIIREAEISRGSFYQYFENKEDLFIYILDSYKLTIVEWLKNKSENKKYDIFEAYLLVYDYITEDNFTSKDKDFLIMTIANMDIKLSQHLMGFLKCEDISNSSSYFNELVNMDNIIVNDPSEIMIIHNILMTIMMNQIAIFFSDINNSRKCREDIINKFNLIKSGIKYK